MSMFRKKQVFWIIPVLLGCLAGLQVFRSWNVVREIRSYEIVGILSSDMVTVGIFIPLFLCPVLKKLNDYLHISIVLAVQQRKKLWYCIAKDMAKISMCYACSLWTVWSGIVLVIRWESIRPMEVCYLFMQILSYIAVLWVISMWVAFLRLWRLKNSAAVFLFAWMTTLIPKFFGGILHWGLQLSDIMTGRYAVWTSGEGRENYYFFHHEIGFFITIILGFVLVGIGKKVMQEHEFI